MIPMLKKYTLIAFEGVPVVINTFLAGRNDDDAIWDYKLSPERFTLRESLAHLADWNDVFRQRIERTVNEDHPTLPNLDEGEIAIQNDYASQKPSDILHQFTTSRQTLVEYVKSLDDAAYERTALRPELGILTVTDQLTLIIAHDGYHTLQVAETVAANR